jgi:hypothetical protein
MTGREEFFTRLTALACMVQNFTLDETVVAIYDRALAPLGYKNVAEALDEIISERNSRDPFPSIKEIKAKILPELDLEAEAALIASTIVGAVSKFGPYRLKEARHILGEVAWAIVETEGGWENICLSLTNDNLGILKAQWRNLAKTFLNRRSVGAPLLPFPSRKKSLILFSDSILHVVPQSEGEDEIDNENKSGEVG